ncbi:MAG: GNAT family protein [Steroidobacteraceae bacterium]|nr:GNAT family protein [Steroidobacteraceae bacterium]
MTVDAARCCEIELRDGARLRIRPIHTDDVERERAFIANLSEQSRYNRLMYSLREPSPDFVRQLTTVDYRDTMAIVAYEPDDDAETFVAVARYARDSSGTGAEFAVTVADNWCQRGVGTALVQALFWYAAQQRITRIHGTLLANNERMRRLAERLGMDIAPATEDARLLIATLELAPLVGTAGPPHTV